MKFKKNDMTRIIRKKSPYYGCLAKVIEDIDKYTYFVKIEGDIILIMESEMKFLMKMPKYFYEQ